MQGRVGITRNLQAYEYCEVVTAWYLNITQVSLKQLTNIEGYFQQKNIFLSNLLTLNTQADLDYCADNVRNKTLKLPLS